jgi:ubiquinone/menaquinone biosynthesis C-methylase UbiE
MLPRAEEQRRRTQLNVELLDMPGECIPLDDASVDTAVGTFTMWTIPGVEEAIPGIGRVLRRGGQFIFFEQTFARSSSAAMAAEDRAPFRLGIRRVPRDSPHSVPHPGRWFQD